MSPSSVSPRSVTLMRETPGPLGDAMEMASSPAAPAAAPSRQASLPGEAIDCLTPCLSLTSRVGQDLGRPHATRSVGQTTRRGPLDFEEIYIRYFWQLCRYLQRIVRDPHSAEEVCQQTFMRVWRALPRFREYRDGSLEGWLYTIAHRCALTELKKKRIELTLDLANMQASEPFDFRSSRTSHWIENEVIERRFTRLSLAQQQVLTLRYLFDMSCAETAKVLHRTTTSVTSIEHRARRALSQAGDGALDRCQGQAASAA